MREGRGSDGAIEKRAWRGQPAGSRREIIHHSKGALGRVDVDVQGFRVDPRVNGPDQEHAFDHVRQSRGGGLQALTQLLLLWWNGRGHCTKQRLEALGRAQPFGFARAFRFVALVEQRARQRLRVEHFVASFRPMMECEARARGRRRCVIRSLDLLPCKHPQKLS